MEGSQHSNSIVFLEMSLSPSPVARLPHQTSGRDTRLGSQKRRSLQDVQVRRASFSGWSSPPSFCLRDIWSLEQILPSLLLRHSSHYWIMPLARATHAWRSSSIALCTATRHPRTPTTSPQSHPHWHLWPAITAPHPPKQVPLCWLSPRRSRWLTFFLSNGEEARKLFGARLLHTLLGGSPVLRGRR